MGEDPTALKKTQMALVSRTRNFACLKVYKPWQIIKILPNLLPPTPTGHNHTTHLSPQPPYTTFVTDRQWLCPGEGEEL